MSSSEGSKFSSSSFPYCSFLCCKSSTISSAEIEPTHESQELNSESSQQANYEKKKPGGWKAMPFIL
ncbi:hypothetical protein PIB30_087076, partial [Stylosanthes scabra]|nr:hypothetical protein [Stylosanthes scabra]